MHGVKAKAGTAARLAVLLHVRRSFDTVSRRRWMMGTRGEIFSSKANTPKRTYFFNVKENRTGDVFLNIVESKKLGEDAAQFERRSLVVFKEDLEGFLEALNRAVEFIRRG